MFCTLFFASENKSSKLKICRASGDFFWNWIQNRAGPRFPITIDPRS